MKDLFRGKLVRLTTEEPETLAKYRVRWQRDSEYDRLLDSDPASMASEKKIKEWLEKFLDDDKPGRYPFSFRTLSDDKLIGFIGMWTDLVHADGWVGVGIGEREFWGKGYGTDAMRLVLQYAFTEINLQRVSLALHSYNERGLKSYEKAGFRLEGRSRSDQHREGRRTDTLWMGVLREEWLLIQQGEAR
jgi:RimJ/RimL family protein N-acetyltransferase